MRWHIKPKPKFGDKRIMRRFALWPMKFGAEWVWLERYFEEWEVKYNKDFNGYCGDCFFKSMGSVTLGDKNHPGHWTRIDRRLSYQKEW